MPVAMRDVTVGARADVDRPEEGRLDLERAPRAVAALKAIRHLRSKLVFCWDDGKRWTFVTMRAGIKRQEKRAGLRVTGWHVLRHTFCSHLAMKGAPSRAIQELAGHQSITVTNRCMHLSPGELRNAIALLNRSPARTFREFWPTSRKSNLTTRNVWVSDGD